MTDDLLARATRALREESAGDDASARLTRARVLGSLQEGRVRRRTRVAFLIPIAATFAAASAFGAAGGRAERAFDAVARVFGVHRDAPTVKPPRPTSHRTGAASAPPAERTREAAPPNPEPVAPPTPEPAPAPVAVAATSSPVVTTAAGERSRAAVTGGAGSSASDPAFELYKAAHRVHFVERDDERALAAWNAYLRAAPGGSFAIEARYNRALCLVRLQRATEARTALEPFAKGRYGGYRQAEAAKLIEALPN
jgi:hypothetical protein